MAKSIKTAFTATTLAAEFGTNPKELRKFLRSPESGIESVGKGARYSFEYTPTQLAALLKKYTAWHQAVETARAARAAELESIKAAKALTVLTIAVPTDEGTGVETDEATPEDDELDIEGMTDDEIESMLDEIATEGLDTDDEVEA